MNTTHRALRAALVAAAVLALAPYGLRALARAHGHWNAHLDSQS